MPHDRQPPTSFVHNARMPRQKPFTLHDESRGQGA
jgi:hypothetical protein